MQTFTIILLKSRSALLVNTTLVCGFALIKKKISKYDISRGDRVTILIQF